LASYGFGKLTLSANPRRWSREIGTSQYLAPSVTAAMLRNEESRIL
jgi:hypothetical protein